MMVVITVEAVNRCLQCCSVYWNGTTAKVYALSLGCAVGMASEEDFEQKTDVHCVWAHLHWHFEPARVKGK